VKQLSLAKLNRPSIDAYRDIDKLPIVVMLDSVRSAMNVGSIFRTADALRLEGLVLCGITAQPPHREITKTAIGATNSVAWHYEKDITKAIAAHKERGYSIAALEQTDASILLPARDNEVTLPLVLIVGNEVSGVSADALALCDLALEIPQFGTKHSLNVAVSTGIALWEIVRTRL
jgi:tRNA G18 (ribose-2'-O)-methylase SpoU